MPAKGGESIVRRGAFGLLLLCIPQILGGGDAKDRSPRRGAGSVRDSAVKSADEHRSRPSDDVASPLVDDADYGRELTRFRIVTSAGILVIYDAAIPPDVNQSRERKRADNSDYSGFVAYWNDFETEYLYVFDRLLFTPDDVAVAVGSLQRDFGLDPALFASLDGVAQVPQNLGPGFDDSHVAVQSLPHLPLRGRWATQPATILVLERSEGDDGSWQPASRELVLAVMGFAADEEGVGGIAGTVWGCVGPDSLPIGPMPAPPPRASPDVLLRLALAEAGCGGGGDPCAGMSCNDGNVCTNDGCFAATGCDNGPKCVNPDRPQCCGFAEDEFACCMADQVCCRYRWAGEGHPDNGCCPPNTTCCGAGCCLPTQTCCNDVCGTRGACCFFDTGSCSELTYLCCQQQGGTFQGDGTTCSPDDLCRPKCDNCQTFGYTFQECFHLANAQNGDPCRTDMCIINQLDTAGCIRYPHREGPPKCNTDTLPDAPGNQEIVQFAIDMDCPAQNVDWHVFWTQEYGCGDNCWTINHRDACGVGSCAGPILRGPDRWGQKRVCGCPPP